LTYSWQQQKNVYFLLLLHLPLYLLSIHHLNTLEPLYFFHLNILFHYLVSPSCETQLSNMLWCDLHRLKTWTTFLLGCKRSCTCLHMAGLYNANVSVYSTVISDTNNWVNMAEWICLCKLSQMVPGLVCLALLPQPCWFRMSSMIEVWGKFALIIVWKFSFSVTSCLLCIPHTMLLALAQCGTTQYGG